MSGHGRGKPLSIDDAFPVGNAAGRWVMVLSMATNDLVTLDGKVHDALDKDGPEVAKQAGHGPELCLRTYAHLWDDYDVPDSAEDAIREACRSVAEVANADESRLGGGAPECLTCTRSVPLGRSPCQLRSPIALV
jgi:hypothetical protein